MLHVAADRWNNAMQAGRFFRPAEFSDSILAPSLACLQSMRALRIRVLQCARAHDEKTQAGRQENASCAAMAHRFAVHA